jgi:hypothetical protein
MCTSEIRDTESAALGGRLALAFSHNFARQDTKGTAPVGHREQGRGGGESGEMDVERACAIKSSIIIICNVKLTITTSASASATAPPPTPPPSTPHMRRNVSQNIMCWRQEKALSALFPLRMGRCMHKLRPSAQKQASTSHWLSHQVHPQGSRLELLPMLAFSYCAVEGIKVTYSARILYRYR